MVEEKPQNEPVKINKLNFEKIEKEELKGEINSERFDDIKERAKALSFTVINGLKDKIKNKEDKFRNKMVSVKAG